jgi:hypothetical protein
MHEVEAFDLETIVKRYDEEMGQAIGDHQILDLKLELILEKLFGARAARRARKGKRRS